MTGYSASPCSRGNKAYVDTMTRKMYSPADLLEAWAVRAAVTVTPNTAFS